MHRQNKHTNDLILYRARMGFTQQHVTRMLGHRSTALVSKIEQGHRLPTFRTALMLAIIYRVPVEFLYSKYFMRLRDDLRMKELELSSKKQPRP